MYHLPLTKTNESGTPSCLGTESVDSTFFSLSGATGLKCWEEWPNSPQPAAVPHHECLDTNFCKSGSGAPVRQPIVFAIGDSHVGNFVHALRLAVDGRARVVSMSTVCGVAPNALLNHLGNTHQQRRRFGDYATYKNTGRNCVQHRKDVLAYLPNVLRSGDVLAIINAPFKFEDASASVHTEYMDLMAALNLIAKEQAASLLLFGDAPHLETAPAADPSNVPLGCVVGFGYNQGNFHCEKDRDIAAAAYHRDYAQQMRSIALSDTNIFFFDPVHLFFDDTKVNSMVPGTQTVVYRDGDHLLGDVAGLLLWPYLCSFLAQTGLLSGSTSVTPATQRIWPSIEGCWRDCL